MLICVSFTDVSPIIAALMSGGIALLGVWVGFKQWKEEKKLQRVNEQRELLTKLVGKCFGNLDFVVLQYRKFNSKYENSTGNVNDHWEQLQKDTEQYVKETEEVFNEVELKVDDYTIIEGLRDIEKDFAEIMNDCSCGEVARQALNSYSAKKEELLSAVKSYLKIYHGPEK